MEIACYLVIIIIIICIIIVSSSSAIIVTMIFGFESGLFYKSSLLFNEFANITPPSQSQSLTEITYHKDLLAFQFM